MVGLFVAFALVLESHPPSIGDDQRLEAPFAAIIATDDEVTRCAKSADPRCRFLLVDMLWAKYADMKVPEILTDMKAVSAAINKKATARDRLAKQYLTLAAAVQDEWGLAASCRAAEVLLEYARFFAEADPPPPAKPTGPLEPFILHSWQVTYPVIEQAIAQIEKTELRAKVAGMDSAYVRRCRSEVPLLRAYVDAPYGMRFPLP